MARNFSWDPLEDNIVEEFDDDGNTIVEYTTEPDYHGNVISQYRNGVTSTFHHDGLGSTIAVTNDAGDVTDTLAYSAFGSVTQRTGTTEFPFQFVGQKGYYFDPETNDYVIRRRPYRAEFARWLSVDPLFRDAMSPYVYASDDPINRFDSSGLCDCGAGDKADKCKIVSFKVKGPSACKFDKTLNGGAWGAFFTVDLEFKQEGCICCEYRQYVASYESVRRRVKGKWSALEVRESAELEEDCVIRGGKRICYGHRGDLFPTENDFYSDDGKFSTKNQVAGCFYTQTDFPSYGQLLLEFSGATAPEAIEIKIKHRYVLVVNNYCGRPYLKGGVDISGESKILDVECFKVLTKADIK